MYKHMYTCEQHYEFIGQAAKLYHPQRLNLSAQLELAPKALRRSLAASNCWKKGCRWRLVQTASCGNVLSPSGGCLSG